MRRPLATTCWHPSGQVQTVRSSGVTAGGEETAIVRPTYRAVIHPARWSGNRIWSQRPSRAMSSTVTTIPLGIRWNCGLPPGVLWKGTPA